MVRFFSRSKKQNSDSIAAHHSARWEKECEAITQKKAKAKRRHDRRRLVLVVSAVLVPAYLVTGGWWLWQSGELSDAGDAAVMWGYDQTRRAGFEVQQIRVEGLQILPAMLVAKQADIAPGLPIFQLDVHEVQQRLEAMPEIRTARVERQLPDRVLIVIAEREPYALWQHDGKQRWIDRDGTVLEYQSREPHAGDLVLVGADVPQQAEALLSMFAATPELQAQVQSAQRVGQRRWDVTLKNGMVVKLPQKDMQVAWRKFSEASVNDQLLDRAIQCIDYRLEGRAIVTLQGDGHSLRTRGLSEEI